MKDLEYILEKRKRKKKKCLAPSSEEMATMGEETGPTNTTGPAIAGTTPDTVARYKMKKKKKLREALGRKLNPFVDPRNNNEFSILMNKANRENVQKLSDLLRIVKEVFELQDDFDWVVKPNMLRFKPKNKEDLDILVQNRHTIRKFLENFL